MRAAEWVDRGVKATCRDDDRSRASTNFSVSASEDARLRASALRNESVLSNCGVFRGARSGGGVRFEKGGTRGIVPRPSAGARVTQEGRGRNPGLLLVHLDFCLRTYPLIVFSMIMRSLARLRFMSPISSFLATASAFRAQSLFVFVCNTTAVVDSIILV